MNTLSNRLNHLWRVAATGFVFVVFGLGAIVISLTMFPVLRFSTSNRETARRRIQRGMQMTFKAYMELMRTLGILTYSVDGLQRLREPGRLIIANHPTLIDIVLLGSLIPAVDCIVKKGLWRNPFLRWPVSWAGYIPNSEGEELVERCSQALRQGRSLLVFPEGTRTVPGRPMHVRRGSAHIALAADAEILPVTITSNPITLFRGNPWYRVPVRRFHMRVVVGAPVKAAAFRVPGEAPSISARRMSQWMLDYYESPPALRPVMGPPLTGVPIPDQSWLSEPPRTVTRTEMMR
jgi:1-acyl-sn-glycerol-3-phosphate acyltransferase